MLQYNWVRSAVKFEKKFRDNSLTNFSRRQWQAVTASRPAQVDQAVLWNWVALALPVFLLGTGRASGTRQADAGEENRPPDALNESVGGAAAGNDSRRRRNAARTAPPTLSPSARGLPESHSKNSPQRHGNHKAIQRMGVERSESIGSSSFIPTGFDLRGEFATALELPICPEIKSVTVPPASSRLDRTSAIADAL